MDDAVTEYKKSKIYGFDMVSPNKISTGEQIRNFYLLGVYFLYKAKRHRFFMEENSAAFDHLNNIYLRCLFLGLSGEYLLKALFVKNGFSLKMEKNLKGKARENFKLKKPAEAINEDDHTVGYKELINSLGLLSIPAEILEVISPKLEELKKWRDGAVHSFHLKKLREKDLEEVYKLLDKIEDQVNPDLKLSPSLYIQVYLDYKDEIGGVRINTVMLQDNITCREEEAKQEMFDVESYFANYYALEESKNCKKNIEEHVIKQLHTHGYI
ncbi:hypothetical protein H0O02_02360, partial [Candidatus Micrarchaeota archaeon]|nr:hypothetical protein [Candidatus Micrarchaeota archaeon]